MPETSQIAYTFKELAELLVKDRGIHDGYWGLFVRFGITAANAGPSGDDLKPTAIVPIVELGLQRYEELTNLSVDAAQVNPKKSSAKAVSKRGGRK